VYGVSKDPVETHQRFAEKLKLPYPLLFDKESAVAKEFGAHGKKMMYGKEVQGTIRSTFLIDESGKIAQVWSPVKVAGHAEAVVAALKR